MDKPNHGKAEHSKKRSRIQYAHSIEHVITGFIQIIQFRPWDTASKFKLSYANVRTNKGL